MTDSKTAVRNYFLLSLLSPVLGLITLLRSGNSRLLLPVGTFLMTILGSIYVYSPESDGESHRRTVESAYLDMGVAEFLTSFFQLFVLNNENAPIGISDPYLHLLGFLSGGIYGIPELLHVFAAFVYGLVYFSILKILFERITLPNGISLIVVLFSIFFIYRGITGFNAIRWWTALWLMLYGFLAYWHYEKRKYLIFSLLAVYIHYSFIAFIFPALVAIWLHKRLKLVMVIWVISFFLGASYDLIKPFIPALEVIEQKQQYTLDEEQLQGTAEARANAPQKITRFYAAFGEASFRDYSIPLLIVFLFWLLRSISGTNRTLIMQLFTAGVLLYAFGNFMEFSPSVSGRAKAGAAPFIMLAGLLNLSSLYNNNFTFYRSYKVRTVMNLFFISSIPLIMYHLSYTLNMLSAFALMLPGASWFLGSDDFSIREFLAMFII
ncbi:EpsG family protein [Lunatibacter salilacus]|uniref:EpsG family protein n=1 Tax=Lunatibacter salilacus TaxID=2483804 RepID=UPI00131B84DA|nr:EpsG family protein [Lunatibacter salilacus]